jgi:hypothetical protein
MDDVYEITEHEYPAGVGPTSRNEFLLKCNVISLLLD